MKPEKFILCRTGNKTADGLVEYSNPGTGVTLLLHRVQPANSSLVTIAPRLTKREQMACVLQEFALRVALKDPTSSALKTALDTLEAIDKEEAP